MPKRLIRGPAAALKLVAIAIVVGAIGSAATITTLQALEPRTVSDGLTACVNWCIKNNRPGSLALNTCQKNCQKYWYCNGSDAKNWKTHCIQAGGRLQVIATPTPQPTTPRTANPNTGGAITPD